MNKKMIVVVAIAVILALGAGFWVWKNKENVEQRNMQDQEKQEETNKIESVKDLIDGEYIFTSIDIYDWQTYRNEEAGFEVKIPKDWFCGGIALDPNSKRSIVCLAENNRKNYYSGKIHVDLIMINFPDLDKINVDSFRENLIDAKKNGFKIYSLTIGGKDSVLVINELTRTINIFDNLSKWNLVMFPSVKKDVSDGFMRSFKFLK